MDHELEQWIDDTKDPKWPCGRGGIGLAGVAIGNWAISDAELRRRILGPKKPKGLNELQAYFNENFHS
jgi:hypothetical protein